MQTTTPTGPHDVRLESALTCPLCGHVKTETMPTDACQWYYECEGCQTVLMPLPGDCCVFCSYGSEPCPPIQLAGKTDGCCRDSGKQEPVVTPALVPEWGDAGVQNPILAGFRRPPE